MTDESGLREQILALRLEKERRPIHVQHVTHLALRLFDGLVSLHGLGLSERLLLEAASQLHDIGHQLELAGGGHHLESARLIRQHPWRGFSPAEVEIMAQVARYHRKGMPELDHEEFRALPAGDRRIVQYLAAMLRLADSLDRSHAQVVRQVTLELLSKRIVVHLDVVGPVLREVKSAHAKGDLAMAVFQRDLVFMVGEDEIKPPLPPGPFPSPT